MKKLLATILSLLLATNATQALTSEFFVSKKCKRHFKLERVQNDVIGNFVRLTSKKVKKVKKFKCKFKTNRPNVLLIEKFKPNKISANDYNLDKSNNYTKKVRIKLNKRTTYEIYFGPFKGLPHVDPIPGPEPKQPIVIDPIKSCDAIQSDYIKEFNSVLSCSVNTDCSQVLPLGCGSYYYGNQNADPSYLNTLITEFFDNQCEEKLDLPGLVSPCVVLSPEDIQCIEGQCTPLI